MAKKAKARKSIRRTKSTPQPGMLDAMNQIWLAGVGALSKARQGAPQILHDLAAEGARFQASTRGSAEKALDGLLSGVKSSIDTGMSQVRGQAADVLDNLEAIFQTRVHRALTQLGVPSAEDVENLSQRVEKLNASINKFARERKPVTRQRSLAGRKTRSSSHAAAS